MNTLKKIALFVVTGILFSTCKKEQLPPNSTVNQPVFSFEAAISTGSGSSNVNWQAGLNNYYMYSSYSQDTSGVYSFIGTLQNALTPNKNSIQIIINDYRSSKANASVSSHIDSALSASIAYAYNKGITSISDTSYKVTFTPRIISGTPTGYNYVFGDGGTSSLAAPTHTYALKGSYNTSLLVNFSSGPVYMGNTFNITNQSSPLLIDSISDTILSRTGDSSTMIKLTSSITGGTKPYTYLWVLGNGHNSTSATFSDTYLNPLDTAHSKNHAYSCLLNVTDNKGVVATFNHIILDTVDPQFNRFDYSMSAPTKVITTTNSLALSQITIVYTDGNGVVYTSKNSAQPGTSSFKITSVSDYQSNSNNQSTKMLKVAFNCLAYNGSNAVLLNGTAVIAVAYK